MFSCDTAATSIWNRNNLGLKIMWKITLMTLTSTFFDMLNKPTTAWYNLISIAPLYTVIGFDLRHLLCQLMRSVQQTANEFMTTDLDLDFIEVRGGISGTCIEKKVTKSPPSIGNASAYYVFSIRCVTNIIIFVFCQPSFGRWDDIHHTFPSLLIAFICIIVYLPNLHEPTKNQNKWWIFCVWCWKTYLLVYNCVTIREQINCWDCIELTLTKQGNIAKIFEEYSFVNCLLRNLSLLVVLLYK